MTKEFVLKKILYNNLHVDYSKIVNILVIYDIEFFFIGDTFIHFDYFKLIKTKFPNSSIDVNFLSSKNSAKYNALISYNPFVRSVIHEDLSHINLLKYDLIISATYKEEELLSHLAISYSNKILKRDNWLSVLSIYNFLVAFDRRIVPTFSLFYELYEMTFDEMIASPRCLYITEGEKEWADKWFINRDCKNGDKVLVILDSTSERSKLLSNEVYFEFLDSILKLGLFKILIFDEKNIGKKEFYNEMLGDDLIKSIIFSEALAFRQDLSLLSSSFIVGAIGPCTGLMHCLSGIYNNFVNINLIAANQAPIIITYTGKYRDRDMAKIWWKDSPLVHCLYLVLENNIHKLKRLDYTSINNIEFGIIDCSNYTKDILFSYFRSQINKKI